MSMYFSYLVILFAVCSFLAWLAENITISIFSGKIRFNNFLVGPFAPYYGFILLLISIFLHYRTDSPLLFFVFSGLMIAIARFVSHYIGCYLFQMKLLRENVRLLLFNAFISAIMCVLLYFVLVPVMSSVTAAIPENIIHVLSLFIVVIFIGLCIIGLYVYSTLWQSLGFLSAFNHEVKLIPGSESWHNEKDLSGSLKKYKNINPEDGELLRKFEKALQFQRDASDILARFPRLIYYVNMPMTIAEEKLTIKDFYGDIKKFFNRLFYTGVDDDNESQTSFARGLNFYKLLWIFFIASIIGYVVETVFCLVTRGYIESRQGMIYGPFSQIYGFGAVIMSIILYRVRHMRLVWIFLASFIIGGLFEAVCSYVQQSVFGTVSWDYSARSFSFLGGRTNLTYMFFWGFLGVFFIKIVYLRMSRFVERIPNRLGINLSILILVFFIFDMLMSSLALYRQEQRHHGVPPANPVSRFIDEAYSDEYLNKIYPNMVKKYKAVKQAGQSSQ